MKTGARIDRKIFLFMLSSLFLVPGLQSQSKYPTNWDYYQQFEQRRQTILHAMAGMTWMEGNDHRLRIYLGITKLATGVAHGFKLWGGHSFRLSVFWRFKLPS